MKLYITNDSCIKEIQQSFHAHFPCLKLEFYSRTVKGNGSSLECHLLEPSKKIGEIRKSKREGELSISPWETVESIEAKFKNSYHLHVQVFRNENGSWIPTTATNAFTLHEQESFSEKARHSIHPTVPQQLKEYDY